MALSKEQREAVLRDDNAFNIVLRRICSDASLFVWKWDNGYAKHGDHANISRFSDLAFQFH